MYYDRVYLCEGQKWDLEREVRKRDYEVQEKWKAATTANNARRKRATAGSHGSLLIISSSRCRPSFAYIRRIRAHHPASLFALSLVLRPTPFLYIRFSFDCCSLVHDVFLGRKHTCGANAGPLRGASQRERFPLMETRGRNTWRRRRLCYPVNLCNLDQSCLDNLADNLWRSIFTFFKRDVFAKRDGIDEHRE